MSRSPDLQKSNRKYTELVSGYDRRMSRAERWQGLAVDRLFLQDGETVIDVACGTGMNFAALRTAVGRRGRIIGIDASPEMVTVARERVAEHGWDNIELIETSVEVAQFDSRADAALFSFTHDVLQSPRSVENVVRHLDGKARVATVGAKYAAPWALPVNLAVRLLARRFVTTFKGLDRPWRQLEPYTGELLIEPLAFGGAYVAWGQLRHPSRGTTWAGQKEDRIS